MPPPRLLSLIFLIFFPNIIFAQSTCLYMKETAFDVDSMPLEPIKTKNLSICTPSKSSCCTSEIETQMQLTSRLEIERSVQDQIILIRQQFDNFATIFKNEFRTSINTTKKTLNQMFEKSYGPFYIQNRQIFDEFFNEMDAYFLSNYQNSNIKDILTRLFRRLYIKIFEIMNPVRTVNELEKDCMHQLQADLKPFGNLPQKISLVIERSFIAWKAILKSMDQANEILFKLLDVVISPQCINQLTKMQQCHVCSGSSPLSKPCSGYCLNVLKGCFAEMAEIDPQWNSMIDGLLLFADRLRGAYNPQQVMAPLPAQISEAIMNFQEKGTVISNRIIMQCFAPELKEVKIRAKRQTSISNEIRIESFESPEDNATNNGDSDETDDDDDDDEGSDDDSLQKSVTLFVDRLTRMKGFFRSLPNTLCTEKRLVASAGEQCWNGFSMGRYIRRVVGDGIASQKRNPEFSNASFIGSKETFIDERLQLAILSKKLNSLFYGQSNLKSIEIYEGSGSIMREASGRNSSDLIEGSGLPESFSDDEDDYPNEINLESIEDSNPVYNDEMISKNILSSLSSSSTAAGSQKSLKIHQPSIILLLLLSVLIKTAVIR